MYLNHFKLKEKPFEMTSDPKFIWMGNEQTDAVANFIRAIYKNKGILLLSGDVGVGKSAFVNVMLKSLANRTIFAKITDPTLDANDFLDILAAEFKIKQRFVSHGDFLMYFNKFLHIANSKNVNVLLIIEEAQLVTFDMFQLLRDLVSIEAHGRILMNIFFVGQSKDGKNLKAKLENTLKQLIANHYHLDPLTETETQKLIQHRLEVAGGKQYLFDTEAMDFIYSFSSGYPRLINLLCDQALLIGYSNDIKKISNGVIKESARSLGLEMKVG
jgi:general secretion pathway protein A